MTNNQCLINNTRLSLSQSTNVYLNKQNKKTICFINRLNEKEFCRVLSSLRLATLLLDWSATTATQPRYDRSKAEPKSLSKSDHSYHVQT